MDYDAWVAPGRPAVSLVHLDPLTIASLGRGDLSAAQASTTVALSEGLVADGARGTWGYRARQLEESPADAPWITRAIVDEALGRTVGMAGFHGPPDERGMVEFGYRVDEERRRQGYARAALEALLEAAAQDLDCHVVRATISPENLPSRALVEQYGFVEVGEQWDDEDGLETIFERPA